MTASIALVVAEERGTTVTELLRALREDGFQTRRSTPAEIFDGTARWAEATIVLVSASLGLPQVASIGRQLLTSPLPATMVVFAQDDFGALEACVRGGFDYVVPPYLPALLRIRLSTCQERSKLAATVEELAATATLHQYERDLSIAREIQSGFLPDALPARPGWQFAARFRPARQVAGDFYDGFELVNGKRLGFVVADVCDKGIGAALFMALIRTLLRHTAEHAGAWNLMNYESVLRTDDAGDHRSAAPVLSVGAGPLLHAVVGTNRYMARNHLQQGYFATLFFCVLDPQSGALLYINGGHDPPMLMRAGGRIETLPPTGPAVGMHLESSYALRHTYLDPGDTLFVYTDGVVDARDTAGARYTVDQLHDELRRARPTAAEGLLDHIDHKLGMHVRAAEQFDDITMLAIRRTDQ
ncbi:MAG TPA: PP2C family protein-serine/threonine phosphatase [Pseudonocardiaceae bacterium]|nr:PP2C family protein-serine/threonine phosphatase [Pseudonocardiaceae bacterium]